MHMKFLFVLENVQNGTINNVFVQIIYVPRSKKGFSRFEFGVGQSGPKIYNPELP